MFNVSSVDENVAVVVLQSVGARSDYFGHCIGSFPWWREFVFFLCRLGPPEYEIVDFEDRPPDLPFVVPAESLLVASEANDDRLTGLFEQVDCILLSLHGSVVVKSLHSWGAMVEVGGQYCLSSVGQEEECEPCGSIWGHS